VFDYPFEGRFRCQICIGQRGQRRGREYKNQNGLRKHIKTHHSDAGIVLSFRCRVCGLAFQRTEELKNPARAVADHHRLVHGAGPRVYRRRANRAPEVARHRGVSEERSVHSSDGSRVGAPSGPGRRLARAEGALSPVRGQPVLGVRAREEQRIEDAERSLNSTGHMEPPAVQPVEREDAGLLSAVEEILDEVQELRVSLNVAREQASGLVSPGMAHSTPAPRMRHDASAEQEMTELEGLRLLDQLSAVSHDRAAWEEVLERTLRAGRRGRRRRHVDSPQINVGGNRNNGRNGVAGVDVAAGLGNEQESNGSGDWRRGAEEPSERQRQWVERLGAALPFEEFEGVVDQWVADVARRPAGVGQENRPAAGRGRGRGRRGRCQDGRGRAPGGHGHADGSGGDGYMGDPLEGGLPEPGHGGGRDGRGRGWIGRGPARGGRGRGRGRNRGNEQVRSPPGNLNEERGYDPLEASRIQKLYRANKKKAVREVLGGQSPFCAVASEEVERHFRELFAKGEYELGEEPEGVAQLFEDVNENEGREQLMSPFVRAEIVTRLSRMPNTAPGPDKVSYWMLRRADPGCYVLTSIFERCFRERRTPRSWKRTNLVLIHKKGDRLDLNNWRPLCLASCVSKLYSGVLADRIGRWAAATSRISWAQKGFMPHEGCYEHNFVVQSVIDDARRNNGQVVVSWMDLVNAFGSLPREYVRYVLRVLLKMPEEMVDVVMELYDGASTRVRTAEGFTDDIPMDAGLRQGDPISPIVFNLSMEPLLRKILQLARTHGYALWGHYFSAVAYADDIGLIASSEEAMRELLRELFTLAEWAGLKFKPTKCASLHVDCRARRQVAATQFEIGGEAIAVLQEGEEYCHLGVPTGFKVEQTPLDGIAQMERDVRAVDQSLLAPWQKIDVVRIFILPRLDFILRGGRVAKAPLMRLDALVKRLVKGWLYLPERASAEVVWMDRLEGGAGLLPLADQVDVASIVHVFRLIACRDPVVRSVAEGVLAEVVRRRLGRQPTKVDVATYLSGSLDGEFGRDGGDIASIWTAARNACRRLSARIGVRWRWSEDLREFQVEIPQVAAAGAPVRVPENARHIVQGRLRDALRAGYRAKLQRKPDQGKVMEATARCAVSNHFMAAGSFTRFADWRFVFRARLGVVPLNGCRRWAAGGDRRCRRCGARDETLPHVLNHCAYQSAAWRGRHDAVLRRLATAVPRDMGEVRVNRKVPGCPQFNLRPDLVVVDEVDRRVTIVDVAIPFENRRRALVEKREEKLRKYSGVAEELRAQGYQVTLDAFIVGALGAWDPANEKVIKHLRIPSRYASLMRRLMVSDAIRWSRDIYVTHVTGHRQWDDPQQQVDHGTPQRRHFG